MNTASLTPEQQIALAAARKVLAAAQEHPEGTDAASLAYWVGRYRTALEIVVDAFPEAAS